MIIGGSSICAGSCTGGIWDVSGCTGSSCTGGMYDSSDCADFGTDGVSFFHHSHHFFFFGFCSGVGSTGSDVVETVTSSCTDSCTGGV